MNQQIATLVFVAGIAGLFWLDRDPSARTSKALWLPVIWFSIASSRSVSMWLGMGVQAEIAGQIPDASPLDQAVASLLILVGAIVLLRRGKSVTNLLKTSWPILFYFSFCLVSLVWSDFPAWGFKRWTRGLGDLIMVLVIATDAQPVAALKRFFTRVGFVLLPLSVLFIKYYPSLGQGWDEYGFRNFQGVTTNKNVLGNLVYLVGLGALWQILTLVRDKDSPDRKRHLLAHIGLVAFGVNLLYTAQCATGTACFILGAGLMLAISLPFFRQRPTAVHALILTLALVGGVGYLLGAKAAITKALGRKPDLTGRTAIWQIVIPMAPNPIGGAGFETFWVGPRVAEVARKVDGYSMTNEAHNGYIEVYLNLGVLGLCLIAIMMGHGYVRSINAFRRDPALGGMFLAYVVTVIFYNITEAGFRILHLEWFFFLLSIVAVNRIIGLNVEVPGSSRVPAYPARPLWATRMSSRPARMGSAARTSFSQDAVTTPSQRKESPARQFLVDGKKTRT